MEQYEIVAACEADYIPLLQIWERSVRATHHFLSEQDIQNIRPLVASGFQEIASLVVLKDNSGVLKGFMGVEDRKIEMLFLDPSVIGKGLGRKLVQIGIEKHDVIFVDVNEQNTSAAEFYRYMGFVLISRSATDPMGNPFPILHLKLVSEKEDNCNASK